MPQDVPLTEGKLIRRKLSEIVLKEVSSFKFKGEIPPLAGEEVCGVETPSVRAPPINRRGDVSGKAKIGERW